jgi:hypothetical protein
MNAANAGLTERDQDMLGDGLAGPGHDHQQPPVIGAQPHMRASIGRFVTRRVDRLACVARSGASSSRSITSRSAGTGQISL